MDFTVTCVFLLKTSLFAYKVLPLYTRRGIIFPLLSSNLLIDNAHFPTTVVLIKLSALNFFLSVLQLPLVLSSGMLI